MTCPPKTDPENELEYGLRMSMGGKNEEEGVFCRANHREAERGGGSSQSGEHSGRSEPQALDYGTDLLSYHWRREYGGMRVDQARRLKGLEKENGRLKRLVADLTSDNAMLKEVARGNF